MHSPAQHDDGLLAWLMSGPADEDPSYDFDAIGSAENQRAEDSDESHCDAVDEVFERVLVAL